MPLLCIAPFLFLGGEFLHFLLVVFLDLSAFLFRAFLEQVYLCLAVLLLEGEQLGSHAFFLFLGVFFRLFFFRLARCSMPTDIRTLANGGSLLYHLRGFCQQFVPFFFQSAFLIGFHALASFPDNGFSVLIRYAWLTVHLG